MNELSNKNYWDSVHDQQASEEQAEPQRHGLKLIATKLLGERCLRYYSEYLLWDVILPKYLPNKKGLKIIEIGSAPGEMLVRLNKSFGYIPYGVEYSESGVELNKKIFIQNNIDPANVIHSDFSAAEFQEKYKNYFDIVLSAGFIEHFDNVEDVIKNHMNLLSAGGYLVVMIPNLRGINKFFFHIFNNEILRLHNLKIMRKSEFAKIFNPQLLDIKLCDYYGTFNFGLFNTKEGSPLRFLLGFCKILQAFLNVIFPFLFKDKGAESAIFSPYLIFIGVKK
ncbi:MAG: class I SAM-dependent methyltransferase [Sedimentisphaerales bacterium]